MQQYESLTDDRLEYIQMKTLCTFYLSFSGQRKNSALIEHSTGSAVSVCNPKISFYKQRILLTVIQGGALRLCYVEDIKIIVSLSNNSN